MLGDIIEAEFHFDRFSEILSPKAHKETPGPGTGLLYDLGSHLIDQALCLFGLPQKIFADIFPARKISQVDDYMELLLFYPSMRVRIKASYVVREPLPSYAIHGTKGSFIKARTDVQEKALQAGLAPDREDWGKEPQNEMGLLHTEIDGKVIRENIEWGIKEELYRADINIDVMTKFRLESMMIPFNVSVFSPGKYNLAATSEQIIEHFVYGLATIKGHKLIQKYNEQRQKKQYDETKK